MKPKTIIEIEGEEGDVTLTITFDPAPPEDVALQAPLVAGLAMEMIQHYNSRSLMTDGGVPWDKLRMPQLNKEYTKEELDTNLRKSMEASLETLKSFIDNDNEETNNAETVSAKRTLH